MPVAVSRRDIATDRCSQYGTTERSRVTPTDFRADHTADYASGQNRCIGIVAVWMTPAEIVSATMMGFEVMSGFVMPVIMLLTVIMGAVSRKIMVTIFSLPSAGPIIVPGMMSAIAMRIAPISVINKRLVCKCGGRK
jgi:hypothetical protein